MRVYFRDQNPAVDHFAFKQSNARAEKIVGGGEGEYITLADGRIAVQLFRCQAVRDNSWMYRLEPSNASTSLGMPYLKVQWPESVKELRAASMIPNMRSIAAAV